MEVAPFTGAWIEIMMFWFYLTEVSVAPFTGAWIEMDGYIFDILRAEGRALHGHVN